MSNENGRYVASDRFLDRHGIGSRTNGGGNTIYNSEGRFVAISSCDEFGDGEYRVEYQLRDSGSATYPGEKVVEAEDEQNAIEKTLEGLFKL